MLYRSTTEQVEFWHLGLSVQGYSGDHINTFGVAEWGIPVGGDLEWLQKNSSSDLEPIRVRSDTLCSGTPAVAKRSAPPWRGTRTVTCPDCVTYVARRASKGTVSERMVCLSDLATDSEQA
jgi:hypothetical protein